MLISQIVKKSSVVLDLEVKDKKDALVKMVDILFKSCDGDKKVFLKAVLDREKLGSTGIGNGCAIPHAKIDSIEEISIAIARIKGGVDFNSLDGERVRLIFMIAAPVSNVGVYLQILANVAKFIKDKYFMDQFMKAASASDVFKIIKLMEKGQ